MAKKGYSPRKTIESNKRPWLEQMYLKFPGSGLVDVSKKRRVKSVDASIRKATSAMRKYGKTHTNIHTHPYDSPDSDGALPSGHDLAAFLNNSIEKSMAIVSQNKKTGETGGSFHMKKKKYIGRRHDQSEILNRMKGYSDSSPSEKRRVLENFADEYHLQYRQLDANGKTVHSYNSSKAPAFRVSILMVGLLASVFFISPSFTGNAIADLTTKTSNLIGVGLFVVSILGLYLHFRKN